MLGLSSAFVAMAPASAQTAQGKPGGRSDAALAAYADAANFQRNGALELAIEGWQRFLAEYPDHEMAPLAAHYLGVCHMEREKPDYRAAEQAFARALKTPQYDLREESLANRGWCLYAAAGSGEEQDESMLREALRTFRQLQQKYPRSRFRDRALFYSGEAAYALGEPERAIDFYQQLLAMPGADDSPLRCDALYGLGVAEEDLQRYEPALASYRKLLKGCSEKDWVSDVHLRVGDLLILLGRFAEAAEALAAVSESTQNREDLAYALFRQGYALVQAERPAEAAAKYERLLAEYPDSRYAAAATLASAQSTYRSGDLELAAERFERVLERADPVAATEAAHWLAQIRLGQGNVQAAIDVGRRQLSEGAEGEFATALRLDLADALARQPESVAESLEQYERAYRASPDDPLAPRALYNAAFSALQVGRLDRADELSAEFLKRFPEDELAADVRFVAAESRLLAGRSSEAADRYDELLEVAAEADDVRRPQWLLRAATANIAAGRFDAAAELLRGEAARLPEARQRAEAKFLLGQAHRLGGRPRQAAEAYLAALREDPQWPRAGEATVLAGQSLLAAGDREAAVKTWQDWIDQSPETRMADQARYKLAQLAGREGDSARAVERYDEILRSGQDPALRPYALYGKGWSLMKRERYEQAIASLNEAAEATGPQHPIRDDVLLARGISHRGFGRFEDARRDLEAFLESGPAGIPLGHALYELALVEQHDRDPAAAARLLQRLVREVPDYPSMDRVRYELAWSLREAGDESGAVDAFTALVERFPDTPLAAEAAYYVGQRLYRDQEWEQAAKRFEAAADSSDDPELSEKALYRLGWSRYKLGRWEAAGEAFRRQAEAHPDGPLIADALMMVGECEFKQEQFEAALSAYDRARQRIRRRDERAEGMPASAERRVREIVLLHGGQSAAQLGRWEEAIGWYNELRDRFPSTAYLPQVFYETGFAYQQRGDNERALRFFGEVANNYRNETAARARFMMGEIEFADRRYDAAITEFQRVMFGFGAEQASPAIKNWQAKSGFEAGRCAEMLMQSASSASGRGKARELAQKFFRYVVEKHPRHELAVKARERIEDLNQS